LNFMELPKKFFRKYNFRPLKYLGQNFLIDKNVLQKIIQAADLKKDDIVLEIGPGLGILTKELAEKAGKVIAVEKDKRMIEILKENIGDVENVRVVKNDILKTNHLPLITNHYKVVANIPYYITSPIIRMFLESKNPPKQIVLLIQKEVAQRICAQPPKMNLLAVSVQFYAEPKIINYVSQKSFWPRPKVDSAIIKISQICTNLPQISRIRFFKTVKAGFSAPRKQLINNLSKGLKKNKAEIKKILLDCGFNLKARPGDLSVEDWVELVTKIK